MSVLCVVVLTYVKPLHEIDAQIPAHVEWLKKVMPMDFSGFRAKNSAHRRRNTCKL